MSTTTATRKPVQSVQQVGPGIPDPKPATRKTPKLTAEQKAQLAADVAAKLDTLKLAWAHTDGTLAAAEGVFQKAKRDLDIQRVYKCRIAAQVATLKASARSQWQPNLNAAATHLGVDKATLRPYVEGGLAGIAAGFNEVDTIPSDEEIRAVMAGYRAATKEGKAEARAAATATEGGEAAVKAPVAPEDPTTQADVIAAVEALQSTLARFTRDQGFSATVAENLAATLAEIGAKIEQYRVDGGK